MSLTIIDIAITSITLTVSFFLYYTAIRVPKGLQLPPGPTRHPIWGNLRDIPAGKTLEYLVYEKWAKKYGDLVYLNVLGQSVLIINSAEMERELFTRRSAIYSGRLKTMMIHDLTIFGKSTVVMMDYGEQWTRHRALLHSVLSAKSLVSYHPMLETSARSLAQRLIAEPVNDLKAIRQMLGGFILQFTYGIDVLPKNDPYVNLAEHVTELLTKIVIPGVYKVDNFPIMKYLPSWLPGLQFPKVADQINKDFQKMLDFPYEYAETAFKQGNYQPSFVSKCLENLSNDSSPPEDAKDLIRQVAVAIYSAGIDTMEAQVRLFILAMALHPDVQKKAQEELDNIVGRDSLPSFNDLPNLPYFNALCSESLRWHPASPTHVPHMLRQDDVINGYFIPKGTYCFANSWYLLRSEKAYGHDAHIFRPERFLDGSAKAKPDAAFGYGRRVCPGKALAEFSFSITAATILHVMNISTLENEPLTGIIANHEFTSGVIGRPRIFKCRLDARPNAQNLLSQFLSR